MITTVRTDLTWDGKVAEAINSQGEKKLKRTIKDMTGARDVDIIECNSWDENEGDDEFEKKRRNIRPNV